MKLIAVVTAAVIGASPASAQEREDRVMKLLKEVRGLMDLAEQLLQEESVEKAEGKEKDAVQKLDEVIKKAKSAAGTAQQKQQQPPDAYKPNRTDEPSRFKSRGDSGSWGHLPPKVRDVLFEAAKEEIPAEFLEVWRKYGRLIEDSAK